jgi:hypothetical protein
MKRTFNGTLALALLAVAVAAVAAGCRSDGKDAAADTMTAEDAARDVDAALVSDVRDAAEADGIIAQHTLYPHHFTPGSATLNSLGQRDVAVLAAHFAAPGTGGSTGGGGGPRTLNVRRGDAPDALYDARVRAVTDELSRGGIAADRVRIADGRPGGAGMESERVKLVLQREAEAKPYYEDDDSGGGGLEELLGKQSGGGSQDGAQAR